MSEKSLRVCIVGCGYMGNIHADCWAQVPEAQVVAVVDIIEERASLLAGKFGLERFYTDYREAIDLPDVNVVSVCIPTCLHADASIYAMGRGNHVLSEKPIALDLGQADAMIATARQSDVKFSVGLMRYHSPVMAELKGWFGDGRLNHPAIYWASDIREIRPKREMHDQHANGGPVIDMGVHLFATWLELFGSPAREACAQGFTFAGERPELAHIADKAVDSASVSVRFESGDVGNFLVTWGMPPGVVPPAMPEVILTANGVLNLSFSGSHQQASFQREGGEWETIAACDENMYQREINDFAADILQDRPPLVSGEQGRAALQVALAALESIRSGRPVQI
jgi:predicted dehydrogenase